MIDQKERQTQENEHSIRGYVLEAGQIQHATDKVQEYLSAEDAPDVFTPDERVYADLTLSLLEERAQSLREDDKKGVMGPAFLDAYRHLRGIASDPDSDAETIHQAHAAHAAGESAAVKLDALLNAAHQGKGFGEAVNFIHALPAEEVSPEREKAKAIVDAVPEDQRRALAAALLADLFGTHSRK